LNSEGWIKYIGERNVKTTEQALHYLESGPLKSYRKNGYGLSMVERKSDGRAIGMCGVLNRKTLETPDIGFAFLPEYNGQGYAFEIADATKKYILHKFNIPKLSAITMKENSSSIRLLEKLEFKFVKTICMPDRNEELLLYTT
jgi:RimJ/RimL family protein N-acetyltransferase